MARLMEEWGGNRVWNGSQWMELYWGIDSEYSDGNSITMQGNGKFPNGVSSAYLRLQIVALFDANTLDNNNTFIQDGGSWPGFNGSVSIPTVAERVVYDQRSLYYPAFGSTQNWRSKASLSGIERVPGTTSFDVTRAMPMRAWGAPARPTINAHSVASNNNVTINFSGAQTNPSNDNFTQAIDYTIHNGTDWVETHGQPNNATSRTYTGLPGNVAVIIGLRAWNEDAGVTAWTPWLTTYTKPNAPTGVTATRQTADPTKIDVKFTNGAAHPGAHYVERRLTPTGSWSQIGTVVSTGTTYVDTYATGSTPEYRVRTRTPDGKIYSDYSNIAMADIGSIKQFVPGVVDIFHGSSKVTSIYWQGTEIWKA